MERTLYFEQALQRIFQDENVHNHRILPESIMNELMTLINNEFQIQLCLDQCNPLSLREMICLLLLASGKNPPRCADILNISVSSVITYEARIRKKLKVKTRTQAFFLALRYGFFQNRK